jgi:hypothetical protein
MRIKSSNQIINSGSNELMINNPGLQPGGVFSTISKWRNYKVNQKLYRSMRQTLNSSHRTIYFQSRSLIATFLLVFVNPGQKPGAIKIDSTWGHINNVFDSDLA